MILFPAIDLKEGQCVRLAQGDMDRATVFNDDPAEQARAFQSQGFEYLHVVDLDGAFAGAPRNAQAVEKLKRTSTGKVLGVPTDLTDPAAIENLFKTTLAVRAFGFGAGLRGAGFCGAGGSGARSIDERRPATKW